jgi:5-formyltetrahydrofolate cyclo-ligase
MGQMDIVTDKKRLRARMTALRDAIRAEEREARSRLICRHAFTLLQERMQNMPGKTVLVYVPYRSEADTRLLIRDLWQAGMPVSAPKALVKTGELALYRIEHEGQLKPGAYGIPEPDPQFCDPVDPASVGAVIVPGLAFDRDGGRLGYGAGYYDRLFRGYEAGGLAMPFRLGFAFAAQVVDRVPTDEGDVPVDRVVTEDGAL